MSHPVPPAVDGLLDQLRLLMPEADIGLHGPSRPGAWSTSLTFVPSLGRARMLVPRGRAGAATAVLVRSTAADGAGPRVARRALALLLMVGGRAVMRSRLHVVADEVPDLVRGLAEAAGLTPDTMELSVGVGAARANAKPVLAVHDAAGRVRVWAKVATNDLTTRLVQAEHHALEGLAGLGLRCVRAPRSLGLLPTPAGDALLMEPVTGVPSPSRGTSRVPLSAMAEVALAGGTSQVAASVWSGASDAEPGYGDLPPVAGPDHGIVVGAWHGDWGPWNMSWRDDLPQVWDWERYSTGAPVGVDVVHFAAHRALRAMDVRASLRLLDAVAEDLVAPFLARAGIPSRPADVAAVVNCYLALVHRRFQGEGGTEQTGAVLRLAGHYHQLLQARRALEPGRRAPRWEGVE